jgi:hypothetical protein
VITAAFHSDAAAELSSLLTASSTTAQGQVIQPLGAWVVERCDFLAGDLTTIVVELRLRDKPATRLLIRARARDLAPAVDPSSKQTNGTHYSKVAIELSDLIQERVVPLGNITESNSVIDIRYPD